jgi:Cu+-exporting ATPase
MEDHGDDEPEVSVDPVCGMSVDESKAAGKTGYAGQTYYFCSTACQRNFEQDPGAYLPRA